MYTRTLLVKRYSRLAALYSILEIGRQPSFGGFAMADAEASNDPVMTTATGKLFWRNDMSASISRPSGQLPLRRQLLQQPVRLFQIARVKPFSEPAVDRSQQFARFPHLALIAPEAREAHGGAELEHSCPLAAA